MPVALPVIKRLFAKSGNRCSFEGCPSPLIVGELVLAEICHIRARRKTGPRFDCNLTPKERDDYKNLLLFCPTHHTQIDKNPSFFTSEKLSALKQKSEALGEIELNKNASYQAGLIHEKLSKSKKDIQNSVISSKSTATSSNGSAAVSIGGHNSGSINIKVGSSNNKRSRSSLNRIGADANLSGYVDYLCEQYVIFMAPTNIEEKELHIRIAKSIKQRFRLRKKTRNDLPAEKFDAVVDFIVNEKLPITPVGKRNIRLHYPLCLTFEQWRALT